MRNGIYLIWLLMLAFPLSNLTIAGTFTVTNTLDGIGGSFRWAVEQANTVIGPDTILFAIPTSDPRYDPELGVWTIRAGSFSYSLSGDDGTFIDGLSQRDFVGGDPNPLGPEIQITGPESNMSEIAISRTNDITIRGLCANGFGGVIISISGRPPEYGGPISNIRVTGCYLGVDPTGTECGCQSSSGILASWVLGLRIGGDAPEERNVIACASSDNLGLGHCGNVEIVNNLMGTDRTGTVRLANSSHSGVTISNTIGPVLFRDNVVGDGYFNLVLISHTECDSGQVTFINNRVGEGLDGTPMGASRSIDVGYSPGHLFKENIIAHSHSSSGIRLRGDITDYVTITRNSIYDDGGLGINLQNSGIENNNGVDWADGIYGPGVNEEIDTPLCESLVTDASCDRTTAYFRCMRNCVVEVFIGYPVTWAHCSEWGYDKVYSGKTYLGDAEEVVQGPVWSTYRFTISPALAPGTLLTCTATNQNGSTSEFGCSCQVPVSGESAIGCIPEGYAFEASAPNRGRNGIDLRYRIPEPTLVRIRVYDIAGHQVADIEDGPAQAGRHTVLWKPRRKNGTRLPSGTYLVRLTTDRFVATREVVLVR